MFSYYKQIHLGRNVFQWNGDDEKVAPSIEDIAFLDIMVREVKKDRNHNWVAPLPFKSPRCRLSQNRTLAEIRLTALIRNFTKKHGTQRHFFMEKLFKNGHAEKASPLKEGKNAGTYQFSVCIIQNIMEYP